MLRAIRNLFGFTDPPRQQPIRTFEDAVNIVDGAFPKEFKSILIDYSCISGSLTIFSQVKYEFLTQPSFEILFGTYVWSRSVYIMIIDRFISRIHSDTYYKMISLGISGYDWTKNSLLSIKRENLKEFETYDSFSGHYKPDTVVPGVSTLTPSILLTISVTKIFLPIYLKLDMLDYLISVYYARITSSDIKILNHATNVVFDLAFIYILDISHKGCKELFDYFRKPNPCDLPETFLDKQYKFIEEHMNTFQESLEMACTSIKNQDSKFFLAKISSIIDALSALEILFYKIPLYADLLRSALKFLRAYHRISIAGEFKNKMHLCIGSGMSAISENFHTEIDTIIVFLINLMSVRLLDNLSYPLELIKGSYSDRFFWKIIDRLFNELKDDIFDSLYLNREDFKWYFTAQIINYITGFSNVYIVEKYDWKLKPSLKYDINILKEKFKNLSSDPIKSIMLCDRTYNICNDFLNRATLPQIKRVEIEEILNQDEINKLLAFGILKHTKETHQFFLSSNYCFKFIENTSTRFQ